MDLTESQLLPLWESSDRRLLLQWFQRGCLILVGRRALDITKQSLDKAEPRNSAIPFPSRKEGKASYGREEVEEGRGLTFERRNKAHVEDAGEQRGNTRQMKQPHLSPRLRVCLPFYFRPD